MTKSFKIIFALIIPAVLIAGAVVYKFNRTNKSDKTNRTYTTNNNAGISSIEEAAEGSAEPTVYTHPTYGFTLTLPPGMKAGSFEQGDGDMVMVSNDQNYQMQIYIRPFDEDVTLTAQRIKRDIPDLKIDNPVSVQAGGETAVSFIDLSDNTRQVWFVHEKSLYQVSAAASGDNITGWIMERWVW